MSKTSVSYPLPILSSSPLIISQNALVDSEEGEKLARFSLLSGVEIAKPTGEEMIYVGANQRGLILHFISDPKTRLQLDFDLFEFKLNVRDPLVKAMGHSKDKPVSTVLDLTAGWGEDAVHLMQAGFKVTALERNPVVYAFLDEAWNRSVDEQLISNLRFVHGDAAGHLSSLEGFVDTIYFDPMFPHKKRRSAAVRKQMNFMQALVGEPNSREEAAVLALARLKVTRRVVVKRPLKAPFIDGAPPSGSIKGKLVRFDIYSPARNI